ncbi:MAG: hypothetical protein ACK4MJ_08330, partial [Hylemonella sp.]
VMPTLMSAQAGSEKRDATETATASFLSFMFPPKDGWRTPCPLFHIAGDIDLPLLCVCCRYPLLLRFI